MESTLSFERSAQAVAAAPSVRVPIADDKAMLRAAAELTRDLIAPRPGLYWGDMVVARWSVMRRWPWRSRHRRRG